MITYTDIVRYDNISFDDYLKLPGYSHSFLKSNINGAKKYFNVTDNVRIGAMVDAILTEPAKADMTSEIYPFCKEIAYQLIQMFGDALNACSKQASYTATMGIEQLKMKVTGRLDLLLEGFAVIDLKITKEKEIDPLVQFMGYENQLWHYSKMANVPNAYLMFYSIPLKKVIVKKVDVSGYYNEFWMSKIIDFGTATTQYEEESARSLINYVYPI